MSETTTITVRVDAALRDRLEAIAARSRRSKSFLAAEAIEDYVAVQEWQIAHLEESLAQADRSEVIDHDTVRAWANALGTDGEHGLPRPRRT